MEIPLDAMAEHSYRRTSIPETRPPPEIDTRSPGVDVHPGMDRIVEEMEPTDPEVFNRPPRSLTPFRPPLYEVPRMTVAAVEAALTPGVTTLIDNVLEEINRESSIDDVSCGSTSPAHLMPDVSRPPPPYGNIPATQTSGDYGYVDMSSLRAEAGSSRGSRPLPSTPIPSRSHRGEPSTSYDSISEPSGYHHPLGEPSRAIPVPQNSPPPLRSPVPLPTPIYYRDYQNPYVRPAYSLICHSAWYVQIAAELTICAECATSEHTFCLYNRPNAVWRQLHVISRTFVHTDLHCGRCYKLLMKTRRAIDCFHCRTITIELHGRIEHLTYKILCEAVVPRGGVL